METRPTKDYTHLVIAVVLLCFAVMAFDLEAPYVAGLMALGLAVEIAAWAYLRLRGPRTYTEIRPLGRGEKRNDPGSGNDANAF